MRIPADIINALTTRARCDGPHLRLDGDRLDPRLYERTAEVLEGAGGPWDRRVQAHVFPGAAADHLARLLADGEVTTKRETVQQQQYFPTPPPVVARLLDLADIKPGATVLEPSAGRGAIVTAAAARGAVVDAVELDPGYAAVLEATDAAREVTVADFLATPPRPRYDRVVMNPPFTKGADIAHVTRALDWLTADGLAVAVMSKAVCWQNTPAAAAFRDLVAARHGTVEALPAGAFAASGTGVATVIVTIPARVQPQPAVIAWPGDDTQRGPEPDPAVHEDPIAIARQIVADLAQAQRKIEAVVRSLQPRPSKDAVDQMTLDTLF